MDKRVKISTPAFERSESVVSAKKLVFAAIVLGFVGACATSTGPGFDDDDGAGGEGEVGGAGGDGLSSGSSSSGKGGASSSSSSSASSSGSSSSSASSGGSSSSSASSSSSSSSSSGGPMCGASEHLCSGICAGNTPETGCFTSQTCTPCAQVQNGSPFCSAQGVCDVSCNSGYQKNGSTCVCSAACCQNADCPSGQTCMAGVCSGGGGSCDPFVCTATCIIMGQIGTCLGDTCVCVTPP